MTFENLQGTHNPEKGTNNPVILGVDYGTSKKLCVHSNTGPIVLPKNSRGLTNAQKFAESLEYLLALGDVVTESPTVGSSGAEPELVKKIVDKSNHTLYTLPARAVKNYTQDNKFIGSGNFGRPSDSECAEIIYTIATTKPETLQTWRFRSSEEKLNRKHTSVRPYDQRNYKDSEVDRIMSYLPPYESLPPHLQKFFGNGNKIKNRDYNRARTFPFAQAFEETGAETRDGYERITGLYGAGYPSHYRRATIGLLKEVSKDLAGVTQMKQVDPAYRKQAWPITRKMIRELYHLAKGHATSL